MAKRLTRKNSRNVKRKYGGQHGGATLESLSLSNAIRLGNLIQKFPSQANFRNYEKEILYMLGLVKSGADRLPATRKFLMSVDRLDPGSVGAPDAALNDSPENRGANEEALRKAEASDLERAVHASLAGQGGRDDVANLTDEARLEAALEASSLEAALEASRHEAALEASRMHALVPEPEREFSEEEAAGTGLVGVGEPEPEVGVQEDPPQDALAAGWAALPPSPVQPPPGWEDVRDRYNVPRQPPDLDDQLESALEDFVPHSEYDGDEAGAVTKIQAMRRGWASRRELEEQKAAALKIQALTRGKKGRARSKGATAAAAALAQAEAAIPPGIPAERPIALGATAAFAPGIPAERPIASGAKAAVASAANVTRFLSDAGIRLKEKIWQKHGLHVGLESDHSRGVISLHEADDMNKTLHPGNSSDLDEFRKRGHPPQLLSNWKKFVMRNGQTTYMNMETGEATDVPPFTEDEGAYQAEGGGGQRRKSKRKLNKRKSIKRKSNKRKSNKRKSIKRKSKKKKSKTKRRRR